MVHHQQSIIVQPCVDKPVSRECCRGSFEEPQIFLTSFQGPHRKIPGAPLLNVISPPSPCFPPSVYILQTANSMLWVIFNLSRNPGAQRRLLEEIRTVVPPDQDPCGEHIKSMPFLKACLKESMRYSRTGGRRGCPGLSPQLPYQMQHVLADNPQEMPGLPGSRRQLSIRFTGNCL